MEIPSLDVRVIFLSDILSAVRSKVRVWWSIVCCKRVVVELRRVVRSWRERGCGGKKGSFCRIAVAILNQTGSSSSRHRALAAKRVRE
jgi:hypothetical protein